MNSLVIRPDIFNGDVKAFFTKKSVGTDINRLSGILSIGKLDVFLPVQKHTDEVLVLSSDPKPEIADAVITNREGILIGVQVADCVPILLFDEKKFGHRCRARGMAWDSGQYLKEDDQCHVRRVRLFAA